jgi:alkanesulfonate monooxygenase SsuD/methylene tetrahydromethanopterin reductase-like flavin-dependent oxidoreductase (luciferase family)
VRCDPHVPPRAAAHGFLRDARAVSVRTPSTIEPWFSLNTSAGSLDANAEADQLDLLLAGVECAVERGCERVWLEGFDGLEQSSDSIRLALWVAGQVASVRVVATGIRVERSPKNDEARTWIRLAEDAATADGLCGGRLELAFADTSDDLAETVSLLREAWSGARISLGDGGDPIEIHPRPGRADGPMLWARVTSAESAEAALVAEVGAILSSATLARDGLPSVYLADEADEAEVAVALPAGCVAERHLVPANAEDDVAGAWIAKLESALSRSA